MAELPQEGWGISQKRFRRREPPAVGKIAAFPICKNIERRAVPWRKSNVSKMGCDEESSRAERPRVGASLTWGFQTQARVAANSGRFYETQGDSRRLAPGSPDQEALSPGKVGRALRRSGEAGLRGRGIPDGREQHAPLGTNPEKGVTLHTGRISGVRERLGS